jgi:hypothetical protein
VERWREYERAYAAWLDAPETLGAADALTATVRDLEQRGLLQYDRQAGRWDLHPVVRAVAFSGLGDQDRDHFGQQILDHFSQRPHNPYQQAGTLEDLRDGITVVRTLLQMGRKQEAWDALNGDLINALHYNVEAYPRVPLPAATVLFTWLVRTSGRPNRTRSRPASQQRSDLLSWAR